VGTSLFPQFSFASKIQDFEENSGSIGIFESSDLDLLSDFTL